MTLFDLQRPKSWRKILKIKAIFVEKMPEKVEIITRTPAELRPSDFSLRFLTQKSDILAEFRKNSLTKYVVLNLIFLLVYES